MWRLHLEYITRLGSKWGSKSEKNDENLHTLFVEDRVTKLTQFFSAGTPRAQNPSKKLLEPLADLDWALYFYRHRTLWVYDPFGVKDGVKNPQTDQKLHTLFWWDRVAGATRIWFDRDHSFRPNLVPRIDEIETKNFRKNLKKLGFVAFGVDFGFFWWNRPK